MIAAGSHTASATDVVVSGIARVGAPYLMAIDSPAENTKTFRINPSMSIRTKRQQNVTSEHYCTPSEHAPICFRTVHPLNEALFTVTTFSETAFSEECSLQPVALYSRNL